MLLFCKIITNQFYEKKKCGFCAAMRIFIRNRSYKIISFTESGNASFTERSPNFSDDIWSSSTLVVGFQRNPDQMEFVNE
jgi:hypothetical protein